MSLIFYNTAKGMLTIEEDYGGYILSLLNGKEEIIPMFTITVKICDNDARLMESVIKFSKNSQEYTDCIMPILKMLMEASDHPIHFDSITETSSYLLQQELIEKKADRLFSSMIEGDYTILEEQEQKIDQESMEKLCEKVWDSREDFTFLLHYFECTFPTLGALSSHMFVTNKNFRSEFLTNMMTAEKEKKLRAHIINHMYNEFLSSMGTNWMKSLKRKFKDERRYPGKLLKLIEKKLLNNLHTDSDSKLPELEEFFWYRSHSHYSLLLFLFNNTSTEYNSLMESEKMLSTFMTVLHEFCTIMEFNIYPKLISLSDLDSQMSAMVRMTIIKTLLMRMANLNMSAKFMIFHSMKGMFNNNISNLITTMLMELTKRICNKDISYAEMKKVRNYATKTKSWREMLDFPKHSSPLRLKFLKKKKEEPKEESLLVERSPEKDRNREAIQLAQVKTFKSWDKEGFSKKDRKRELYKMPLYLPLINDLKVGEIYNHNHMMRYCCPVISLCRNSQNNTLSCTCSGVEEVFRRDMFFRHFNRKSHRAIVVESGVKMIPTDRAKHREEIKSTDANFSSREVNMIIDFIKRRAADSKRVSNYNVVKQWISELKTVKVEDKFKIGERGAVINTLLRLALSGLLFSDFNSSDPYFF